MDDRARALAVVDPGFPGVFLRSTGSSQTNFTFEDTLSQIGLGYTFLFVLAFFSVRVQWVALAVILRRLLGGVRALSAPGSEFDFAAVGVPASWPHHPTGFAAHWDKNSNLAWAFDTWFLNLFPRERAVHVQRRRLRDLELHPHAGDDDPGPAGRRGLESQRPGWAKVLWLIVAGILALAGGWGLGELGVCPVVKRIWTPSWVLFSGGWCFLFLAGFYADASTSWASGSGLFRSGSSA